MANTSNTRVHRCRFLDHVPHAIESLDVDPSTQRLAVLRANADLEVWSLKRGEPHFCEFRIAGAVGSPGLLRRVAWGSRSPRFPAGRLFTCGLHGLLTEWDLRSLSPRASWDSGGGPAWTMDVHVASRTMAVGCEDGGCSIFDLSEDHAEPMLRHRTPPQGGRLLGVSLSPQGSHLACSAADGSVRVWHVASWQALSRYVLESEGRRKPPLVWSIALLSDLTVVTGDSTGHVCFYDGQHGTLLRRFGSHQADILALAVSRDETRVFAAGVDQKVVCFSPTPPANQAQQRQQPAARGWLIACSRRPHTHDVRALVAYEPRDGASHGKPSRRNAAKPVKGGGGNGDGGGHGGNGGSSHGSAAGGGGGGAATGAMLLSGGIDSQLSLTSLEDFERAPPLKLLPFPRHGSLALSRRSRRLLLHDGTDVNVWQLPELPADGSLPSSEGPAAADGTAPRKLLLLKPKLSLRNVHCVAMSEDGSWLVVCHSEVALYRLSTADGADDAPSASVRRVPLPAEVLEATCCTFSPDERLLLLGGLSGLVQAITLDADAEPTVLSLRAPPEAPDGGGADGHVPRAAIVQIAASDDGQWIATLDAARRVHTHSVDGLCYSSTVPPLASAPTALAFAPDSALLTIASANKQLTQFDVDRAQLTSWSQQHARPIAAVASSSEVAHAIAFNPAKPHAPILCAQSWLCRVETGAAAAVAAAEKAATAIASGVASGKKSKKKRRRDEEEAADTATGSASGGTEAAESCHVTRSYGGMLHFDFLGPDAALVVEQPWLRVMDLLPPALYKHRFGT